jgi:hypothetical protein
MAPFGDGGSIVRLPKGGTDAARNSIHMIFSLRQLPWGAHHAKKSEANFTEGCDCCKQDSAEPKGDEDRKNCCGFSVGAGSPEKEVTKIPGTNLRLSQGNRQSRAYRFSIR